MMHLCMRLGLRLYTNSLRVKVWGEGGNGVRVRVTNSLRVEESCLFYERLKLGPPGNHV